MRGNAIIDSNILIYAYDTAEADKHRAANEFLRKAINEGKASLSTQNLVEFYARITRGRKGAMALDKDYSRQLVEDFVDSLNIISYDENTVLESLIVETNHGIHFWDALLAATMLENGIRTIYTENTKDFSKVPGIKAVNPLK